MKIIIKNLKVFSQNIHKNHLFINIILENQKEFDILFIQELPWSIIRSILSITLSEGEEIVGAPNHLSWITFTRYLSLGDEHPRVITYIKSDFSSLCFSLRKDIYNYRVINLISFVNSGSVFYLLNMYFNDHQSALKYLKNTEANLSNVIIIIS